MSLQSRIQTDNQRILGGDDSFALKLYNASGTSQTAKGRFTAPGISIDPYTATVNTRKRTVAFHISDFSTITGSNENYKGWSGEFVDSEGDTITGRFTNTHVSKTFGYVVTTLTGIKA